MILIIYFARKRFQYQSQVPKPNVTNLNIGASVSINGVCLTVVAIESDIIQFDIINETLERTNLGDLVVGDMVNIERSLKFGDEVGGHILSGHIFGTGIISTKTKTGDQMSLSILAPPVMRKYLTEKGYIAIEREMSRAKRVMMHAT